MLIKVRKIKKKEMTSLLFLSYLIKKIAFFKKKCFPLQKFLKNTSNIYE